MEQFKICQDILENNNSNNSSYNFEIDFISNLKILEFGKSFIKFSFNIKKETLCNIIFSSISNYFGMINYIGTWGNKNINKVNYNFNSIIKDQQSTFQVGKLLIISCEIEKITNTLIFQRLIFSTFNSNKEMIEIAKSQIIFKKLLLPSIKQQQTGIYGGKNNNINNNINNNSNNNNNINSEKYLIQQYPRQSSKL